jgi:LPS-assembly protein
VSAKRTQILVTTGLLIAGGQIGQVTAGWDCRQDPVTGSWTCDGGTVGTPAVGDDRAPPARPSPAPPLPPQEPARAAEPSQPARPAAPVPTPQGVAAEPVPAAAPMARPAPSGPGAARTAAPPESQPIDAAPEVEEPERSGEREQRVPQPPATPPRSAAPPPGSAPGTAPHSAVQDKVTAAQGAVDAGPARQKPQDAASAAAPEQRRSGTPPPDQGYRLDFERLYAGLTWDYCGSPPPGTPAVAAAGSAADGPIAIGADSAELYRDENRALLQGDVVVDRGTQHLEAGQASYYRDSGRVEAWDGVLLEQPGIRLLSREMQVDLIGRQAWAQQSAYRLTGTNARGTAARAHLETPTLSHYQDISYTACAPGDDSWELTAEKLDVDRDEGRAVARHAKLRLRGIPVFYTPYMSFPLDDRRKSGLLPPSIGSSARLGLDLSLPYYLNLAPNMDATVTPRYLSKRGAMLGAEFRFLTASEEGQFNGELIPNDRGDQEDGMRGGFTFQQRGLFAGRWATDLHFDLVSDDTYLEDFGRELKVTSTRNLERRADLRYFGRGWTLLGRVQGFQTVDHTIAPTARPYERLPQLLLYLYQPLPLGLALGLEAENTWFHHTRKVHGNRLALRPSLSLPVQRPYGQLTPRLTLNHASYWLTDQAADRDDRPSLTLPTLSLDGQLVFERSLSWLGQDALQTLEPRLFYLYTPFEDQNDLPLFDSAELDFSFASLFRENRFSGRDRIGDANQLTLALTSRTLSDRDGRELFRVSLGQILYFADRRVQIAGGTQDDSTSALAAELAARVSSHWSGRVSTLWDPNRDDTQLRKNSLVLHYRDPRKHIVNLAYRLNETELDDDTAFEDTDLSFRWPLNPRFELVGRWLYSLRHERTMEAFGGLEYGRCCWRVRFLVRQFVNSPDQVNEDLSLMLQVELSGLGAFGSDVPEFLERNIYGYAVE